MTLGRVVATLVDREYTVGSAAKVVAHRQRLVDLASSPLDCQGSFTAAEFEERLQAQCGSIQLLVEIGELERAAELLSLAADYLRPMDVDLTLICGPTPQS